MSNPNEPTTPDDADDADDADERRLRGRDLEGAERDDSVEHETYRKKRNPDTELRLDGEKDDLYNDGLDIDEETDPLAGTSGGGTAGAKG